MSASRILSFDEYCAQGGEVNQSVVDARKALKAIEVEGVELDIFFENYFPYERLDGELCLIIQTAKGKVLVRGLRPNAVFCKFSWPM